jgi:hypothetical protein
MAEFPELKAALHQWMQEVTSTLVSDPNAPYVRMDLAQWGVDPDGVFRDIERPMDGWDYRYLEKFQNLASWSEITKIF